MRRAQIAIVCVSLVLSLAVCIQIGVLVFAWVSHSRGARSHVAGVTPAASPPTAIFTGNGSLQLPVTTVTPPGNGSIASPTPATAVETALTAGNCCTGVWFANATTGWVAGPLCSQYQRRPGLIEGTTDGGQTWSIQYLGEVQIEQIQFADSLHGWAVGTSGEECRYRERYQSCMRSVLRTIDGGRHWTETYTAVFHHASLFFTPPRDGWLRAGGCEAQNNPAACSTQLLITSDGGQSRRTSPLPTQEHWYIFAHPTTADGWAASGDQANPYTYHLLVTHDGGASRQPLPDFPTGPSVEQILFRTPSEGWFLDHGTPATQCTGQSKVIFATKDGGNTWTEIASTGNFGPGKSGIGALDFGGCLGRVEFVSDTEGWMSLNGLSGSHIQHSMDGGRHWEPAAQAADQVGAHANLDFHFVSPRFGWLAFMNPPRIWVTMDGGATWQQAPLPKAIEP